MNTIDYPSLQNFNQLTDAQKIDVLSEIFADAICSIQYTTYDKLTSEQQKQADQIFINELQSVSAAIDDRMIYDIPSINLRNVVRKYLLNNSKYHLTANKINHLQGQKVTMFKLSDFGFPVAIQTTLHSAIVEPYAQYSDSLKIIHKPKRKRSYYSNRLLSDERIIIYSGWIDVDVKSLSNNTIKEDSNVTVTQSKYASFDSQYLTDIINHINQEPLITL